MAPSGDGFSTRGVHDARADAPANSPARTPIYQSAGWTFADLAQVDAIYERRIAGAIYGSDGNPNLLALEAQVASLEGAPEALATSAGMAAFAATFMTILHSGDRVVAAREVYGNTLRLLGDFERFGVSAVRVDATDPSAVDRALSGGARLLAVETISNPRLRVADIPSLGAAAKRAGGALLVDNTFATPYHCTPLALGADLAMESGTKFLGGHHDVVIGTLAGTRELLAPIRTFAVRAGMVPGAFDAWLAERSIETLAVRMARGADSALELARWLASHQKVRRVHYPGLPDHPDHAIAKRVLQRGFGSMISFEIDGGAAAVDTLLARLARIRLVLSLGGTATTLSHPAKSSHRALSQELRDELGLHDGFLRMSVGIEDVADIQTDLARGLDAL
ncbi:MAG TPA: aminotransferase class I/II-fold pyridoxal phosphate-dependent enzyme [Candidatus Eremiobacteraceae bacterium]|nr:aminotransferase class I/II-fold pyridoxal phosphate-dependent enzyme [Candidatus Eremiobacteraceae bacterium]